LRAVTVYQSSIDLLKEIGWGRGGAGESEGGAGRRRIDSLGRRSCPADGRGRYGLCLLVEMALSAWLYESWLKPL